MSISLWASVKDHTYVLVVSYRIAQPVTSHVTSDTSHLDVTPGGQTLSYIGAHANYNGRHSRPT